MAKTVADFARHVSVMHNQAIDDELHRLLGLGIPFEGIALEHHPNMRTVIKVDGRPVAEFQVSLRMN